jgi:hypothetical protein
VTVAESVLTVTVVLPDIDFGQLLESLNAVSEYVVVEAGETLRVWVPADATLSVTPSDQVIE